MKVSLVRSGGVAGVTTRTELDAGDLSPEDARTFSDRIDRARLCDAPRGTGARRPDQLLYELVLDTGESRVRARFDDQTITEGARLLIEWIDSRPERSHRLEP